MMKSSPHFNGLQNFQGTLVKQENLALFHHPITVDFPKHFESLHSVFTEFHTKLDCITLLQKIFRKEFYYEEEVIWTFQEKQFYMNTGYCTRVHFKQMSQFTANFEIMVFDIENECVPTNCERKTVGN
ncbi:hypothetical protein TNCV_1336251 [Trichonephila clavipes]|nr:hypothetical protein TNCV_1336251 [Trichonephila clavipes]